MLWQCSIYATVWSSWLEHNSHTFNDRILDKQVLWDRIRRLVSVCCKAVFLEEFPLRYVERLENYASLIVFPLANFCSCIEDLLSSFLLVNFFLLVNKFLLYQNKKVSRVLCVSDFEFDPGHIHAPSAKGPCISGCTRHIKLFLGLLLIDDDKKGMLVFHVSQNIFASAILIWDYCLILLSFFHFSC